MNVALPGGLLVMFLYWQVVPVLMAATGASLELRKLKVYPIPVSQLFAIEVMLRVTAAIEMVLVLIGIAVGVALNPLVSEVGGAGGDSVMCCSICSWRRVCAIFWCGCWRASEFARSSCS